MKREILEIDVLKIGNKIDKVVNSEKPYVEYKKLVTNCCKRHKNYKEMSNMIKDCKKHKNEKMIKNDKTM